MMMRLFYSEDCAHYFGVSRTICFLDLGASSRLGEWQGIHWEATDTNQGLGFKDCLSARHEAFS